jgi:hypothetical protein
MTENTTPSLVPCRSRASRSVKDATWSGLGLLGMFMGDSIAWQITPYRVDYFDSLGKRHESAYCFPACVPCWSKGKRGPNGLLPACLSRRRRRSPFFGVGSSRGRPPRKMAARGEGGPFVVLSWVLAPSRLSQREPVRGRVGLLIPPWIGWASTACPIVRRVAQRRKAGSRHRGDAARQLGVDWGDSGQRNNRRRLPHQRPSVA